MNNKAFSLIELMVVIAIVAVLAAVAVPMYRDYMNKARMLSALQYLQMLHQNAMVLYDKGQLNSTIVINGLTFADNAGVAVNASSVSNAVYLAANDGYVGANEWMFCVSITGLNFPGYVDGSTRYRMCSKTLITGTSPNIVYKNICGSWDPASVFDIPAQYLPAGCNCNSVSSGVC